SVSLVPPHPLAPTLFPYTTLFRSRYAFDSEDHYVPQEYLPERLRGTTFYTPSEFGFEKRIGERLAWWAERRREAQAKEGRDEERSEEHTSELQLRENLVCRLLLEK